MEELEQRLRIALREVDRFPVPQLDPAALAARASGPRPRKRLWAWLVAAVAAVAVAVSGAVVVSTARPMASVTVQIGRGTADPVVGLDAEVATQLFLMSQDMLAAGEGEPAQAPTTGSGFSGLLVVAGDAARPRLWILPDVVYVEEPSGWQRLADANGTFYAKVWDAVAPQLTPADRDALPDTRPAIPRTTAAVPPQVGVTGVWQLAEPESVSPTSTSLKLKVTRLECASGHTGRILKPVVSLGTNDIVIRTDVADRHSRADTCQGNDSVTVTVDLSEPVGDRALIDAACLAGEAVRGRQCAQGAVRWRP